MGLLDRKPETIARRGLRDTEAAERLRRDSCGGIEAWPKAIDHGDWQQAGDHRHLPARPCRSHAEVSGILGAVEAKIGALAQDPWIHQRRVRVKAAGRLSLLPLSTVAVIRKAENATADYDAMTLTIAVAYGGREEIADAVRDLIRAKVRDGVGLDELAEHITPAAIDQHLYTAGLPDPGLIIRTSGEVRLSGFLLWQCVHSEFYFTDVYWPEFRKVDFLRAIRSFQQRTRRFGQ